MWTLALLTLTDVRRQQLQSGQILCIMYLKSLALAAAAAIVTVSAQNTDPSSSAPTLVQLLQSTPELQNLTAVLGQFPGLARALINSTKELTILAPDNDAFAAFLKGPGAALAARNETGLIEGIIEYHVLAGLYPSSKFSDTPAFLSSVLGLPIFTNVTGGQVVEVVKNGSDVEAISGLKAESTVVKAVRVPIAPSSRAGGVWSTRSSG